MESTDEIESQDNYYFNTKGDGRVLGVFRLIARPNGPLHHQTGSSGESFGLFSRQLGKHLMQVLAVRLGYSECCNALYPISSRPLSLLFSIALPCLLRRYKGGYICVCKN